MKHVNRNTGISRGAFAVIAFGILAAGPLARAQQPGDKKPPESGKTLGAPTTKPGQRTLTVNVPQPGDYFVRFIPSTDAKDQHPLPLDFKDKTKTFTFDAANLGKSFRIAIDDAKTGNTAIIPPGGRVSADGATADLGKIDFDHVRQVKVTVAYENKPVQVAKVTIIGSDNQSQTKTLDATSQGLANFDDVSAGKAKLTILYGDKLTETKDVEVTTDHPAGFMAVTASVSNKVPTLDTPIIGAQATQPPAAGGASPLPGAGTTLPNGKPVTPEPSGGGGITGFLGTILGLALVGGAIYLLYRWAKAGGMAATLKKAGIEVSGTPPSDAGTPWNPNAPPPPVVSDPTICQFCGQKKDPAGNCACTLSGAALNTGPASPVIPTQPRLVATLGVYSGSIFPLNANGSSCTLGREATNSIPLGNDTTVSRRHASIRVDSGSYVVSDEGSSNGVYVNGVRISGSQPLNPGDEVQIGNTRFRFEV